MKPTHTPGPWCLETDAQGPCMVMHPKRKGVAIANLSSCFRPVNDYHDDWGGDNETRPTIAERNSNARLIAAAPEFWEGLHMIKDMAAKRAPIRMPDGTSLEMFCAMLLAKVDDFAAIRKAVGE